MRLVSCLSAILLAASAAANVPPPVANANDMKELLAGGWRYEPGASEPPACDQPPSETGKVMTFEFAATGGKMQWETAAEEIVTLGVMLSADVEDYVQLTTPDGLGFGFKIAGTDTMIADGMPEIAQDLIGKTFRKCYKAADRAAIKVEHENLTLPPMKDIDYLSKGRLGEQPRFVDTRFNKSPYEVCSEPVAQYVFFDLVGPLGFSMGRWNTGALAGSLVDGEKLKIQPDDVANWTVEAVEPIENGWKVTATELIPPNNARGDTTSFTVLTKENAMWIPEWKRQFWRCTTGEETSEAPE